MEDNSAEILDNADIHSHLAKITIRIKRRELDMHSRHLQGKNLEWESQRCRVSDEE